MIAVHASFRLPPEAVETARPMMRAVIEATLTEPGCRAYAMGEDVAEPGLIRVTELWDSREVLAAHFETRHMKLWNEQRSELGFHDRRVTVHEIAGTEILA
jgi:quinol monooxygenase YgiN